MLEAIFPCPTGFGLASRFRQRDIQAIFAAALPFILRHVDGDAIEIGAHERLAAKAGQRAEEAKKDILREVVDVVGATGEACEGAKDHLLMIADDLLEAGFSRQELVGLDRAETVKFHRGLSVMQRKNFSG